MIEGPTARIIDASTAHRTDPEWAYGFPELGPGQRAAIAGSSRVSNPGCYATAFIALVRPLVAAGLIPADWPISVNAISGYSGGGRTMIAEFEDKAAPNYTRATVRAYALNLAHKHVPEMRIHAGLIHAPLFAPAVGRYYKGMIVEIPLHLHALPGRPRLADLRCVLEGAYGAGGFVRVAGDAEDLATEALDPEALNGSNSLALHVFGSQALRQARLVAILDNLGKGASGAAVQNLNLMLGLPESTGLITQC
jgi:N-acetyl-gamma-glutamyl-phosphate reductase